MTTDLIKRKKRYHADPIFRAKMIASTRKYQKTKKGIITKNKATAIFYKKHPNYNHNYKQKLKDKGICPKCAVQKPIKGKVTCERCLKKSKIWRIKQK